MEEKKRLPEETVLEYKEDRIEEESSLIEAEEETFDAEIAALMQTDTSGKKGKKKKAKKEKAKRDNQQQETKGFRKVFSVVKGFSRKRKIGTGVAAAVVLLIVYNLLFGGSKQPQASDDHAGHPPGYCRRTGS